MKLSMKRKLIQLASALIYNANLKGFGEASIYQGKSKGVCVPGLNCYSCPGAIAACPLGTLQNALSSSPKRFPFYILGFLILSGLLLGRMICGFLCPFGLIQELFYKIPVPKLKKNKITHILSHLKYIILIIFVIYIPLFFAFKNGFPLPAFCKYICPAGTLEGGLTLVLSNPSLRAVAGVLFTWKVFVLVLMIGSTCFIYRSFCRFLCPLGAIYSLFSRVSVLGIQVDENKCTHCNQCVRHCLMDIKKVGDKECIQCGACKNVCHFDAIHWKHIRPKHQSSAKNNGDCINGHAAVRRYHYK